MCLFLFHLLVNEQQASLHHANIQIMLVWLGSAWNGTACSPNSEKPNRSIKHETTQRNYFLQRKKTVPKELSVSKLIVPINGVFVPLGGVPSCGGHAAAAVGGLAVLVWRVRTGGGGSSQVHGLQRAGGGGMVVVMVVWVSIHPTNPLQPVVGQVFILKHRDKRWVTFDLSSRPVGAVR